MILWLISLALEAVLALLYRRKGGFAAFRRFLWADIIGQAVEIADIQFFRGAWYPWVLFGAEIVAGVLLGFVVAESFSSMKPRVHARALLLISALVAIPAHLILAVPAWSPAGSLLLWSVALSHSIMGMLLALMLITARRFRWHDAILSGWMLGTAVLFYAAPSFAAGYSVLWLNAGTWAALIAASYGSDSQISEHNWRITRIILGPDSARHHPARPMYTSTPESAR